ncbi:hypothetical protein Tco_1508412 [Tanacetum coccineum]
MKYKKKEKELTPSEAAHEEYLKYYPILRTKAVPKSLFTAIRGSQVDLWSFLYEVGFNSFHNLTIDEIPSRVGRFCVANFNSFTYKLSLDSGDSIYVTPSKIHDILGIPVGSISLFSLEARPVEHEFVQSWVDQFYPKPLKKIRLLYFQLLYFDSTKFDGVPVVRTRPAIRAWNSTLMRQREKLELDAHVLGLLELHDESIGGGSMVTSEKENLIKKAEEKLSIVCSKRVFLEGCLMTASEKYPGDRKFFEIHQKYAEVFKNPIEFGYHESSLGDDGNGDDDTGNGDDDDRNGDDNAGVDDDVNKDDYDNVDRNDLSVTDKEDDNGGSKKQVESTEKQSVDPTDPTGEENGDALDAINLDIVRMEESDAGPVTPERLATRVSNEHVFETSSGLEKVFGIRLNMETLAPGLWIDANVVDCWGEVLNYEERFRKKKLFTHHLKLYGHKRHSKIQRLKAKILKLKWKTKTNFRDSGIFTMLHMESYSGQTASTWDCGLVSESKLQCDMLRRLRFKFATKILLHEINVHDPKMLKLAKEFDKLDPHEKLSIMVEAVKNRGERERS